MKKINYRCIFLLIIIGLSINFLSLKKSLYFIIIFLLYLFLNIILKNILNKKTTITLPTYKKNNFLPIILSISVFFTFYFTNIKELNTIDNIALSLIYFLLSLIILIPNKPIFISSKTNMKEAFNISCIKTIIIKKTSEKELKQSLKKLHNAKINLVILEDLKLSNKVDSSFKRIKYEDFTLKKHQNTIITNYNNDFNKIKKVISNSSVYYDENKSLKEIISLIEESRGITDNLIRTISINNILSYSLILSIIFLSIFGFPFPFNYNILLLVAFLKDIFYYFLLPYIHYDSDLMNREPRQKDIPYFNNQEKIISCLYILSIIIIISIPFMTTLVRGSTTVLSTTLSLISYLFCFLILIYQKITEKITVINIIESLKDKRVIFSFITIIISIILISYLPYFNTKVTSIDNYLRCFFISFILITWLDIIKLARFTTIRKKDKK